MSSTTTEIQLPDYLAHLYDGMAREAGVSREAVILQALEAYVAPTAEDEARLLTSIAEAEAGDVIDAEALEAETEAYFLQRGMTREQIAAIEAEVEREADAFYGTCE
jgi:predicted transcriptional regulator